VYRYISLDLDDFVMKNKPLLYVLLDLKKHLKRYGCYYLWSYRKMQVKGVARHD